MDKNEKYLKSIDSTLKDILKELKKSNRQEVAVQLDGKQISNVLATHVAVSGRKLGGS